MAGKYIWTFVLGLAFLYVQLLVMPAFEIAGVIPNILIPWLLWLLWSRERKLVLIAGFAIGLMYDSTQPMSFGLYAFILVVMAESLDQFRHPFEAESLVARLLTILLANIIFSSIQLLALGVVHGFGGPLMGLSLIGFLYNLGMSFVLFWSMQFLSRLRLVVVRD
jgi:rod shape-determining protein MreD